MDGVHQLFDFLRAVFVADGIADTTINVSSHDLQRHLIERAPGGGHLLQDVDAVAPRFDHALDAFDLAFHALEALQAVAVQWRLCHVYALYWYLVYATPA